MSSRFPLRASTLLLLGAVSALSGCASLFGGSSRGQEHECMTRVMYFESNRSSDEGMLAVGTVVMNRVASPQFPNTVCGVVAQKNQFAPGVMTKKMGAGRERAERMARNVLKGYRHRGVGKRAMFFHQAGLTFPYSNMHYVAVAGGNAFYVKGSGR